VRPAIGRRTLSGPDWVMDLLQRLGRDYPSIPSGLLPWLWWSAGCLLMMLIVPMTLLRVAAKTGPRETGLLIRGTGRDALVYAILFFVFIPVVWLVSRRGDFSQTYPFYPRPAAFGPQRHVGGDWIAFEAAYFLQFLSVEYFFRGFMVLGLRPALGRASILVMLAPYCMIHFHKPMLEAFGAIGAGVVLGCLSFRTRTVVYGWFLHYSVALSMDLLSLSQSGRI
jgi:Type II CAAX prenyl endopeptidase Rce1-like